jgi:hypothetical protein
MNDLLGAEYFAPLIQVSFFIYIRHKKIHDHAHEMMNKKRGCSISEQPLLINLKFYNILLIFHFFL